MPSRIKCACGMMRITHTTSHGPSSLSPAKVTRVPSFQPAMTCRPSGRHEQGMSRVLRGPFARSRKGARCRQAYAGTDRHVQAQGGTGRHREAQAGTGRRVTTCKSKVSWVPGGPATVFEHPVSTSPSLHGTIRWYLRSRASASPAAALSVCALVCACLWRDACSCVSLVHREEGVSG